MLAGPLAAPVFVGRAVRGDWGAVPPPNEPREQRYCLLGCARGPPSRQRPPCWAASAPFPEPVLGLEVGALAMERAAQGVSDAASHLPSSDLISEEGSWRPAWLARRGAIPLLWGLNARHNLNEEVCCSDFGVQLLPEFLRRPSAPQDDGDDGPDGRSVLLGSGSPTGITIAGLPVALSSCLPK